MDTGFHYNDILILYSGLTLYIYCCVFLVKHYKARITDDITPDITRKTHILK